MYLKNMFIKLNKKIWSRKKYLTIQKLHLDHVGLVLELHTERFAWFSDIQLLDSMTPNITHRSFTHSDIRSLQNIAITTYCYDNILLSQHIVFTTYCHYTILPSHQKATTTFFRHKMLSLQEEEKNTLPSPCDFVPLRSFASPRTPSSLAGLQKI